MPWMDRPAGVYTRFEVVLHRLDDGFPMTTQNRVSGATTHYDVWEVRIVYVFDASKARWEVQSCKPFGYRRGLRNAPKVEVDGSSVELRNLAVQYAPSWVPDPSKPKLNLPAEDVWDEATDTILGALDQMPSMTRALMEKLKSWIHGHSTNPYRGE